MFAHENQDFNMRLMFPGNTKALILGLYDNLAETLVDLTSQNLFVSVCESLPQGDLDLLRRTINTASMACRPTEENKMKIIGKLFGVAMPDTLGDVGAHVYNLSGSVDAFFSVARETYYIDKQYTFEAPQIIGQKLERMVQHAELMNLLRFDVAMMCGGKNNMMYHTLANFKNPLLEAKVEEYFMYTKEKMEEINIASGNNFISMLSGVFSEEYAAEYSIFVDTLRNIVKSQPRILPLSQDKKILQRASTVGLSGAFAMNSIIMNGRSCDELQCTTLIIEIQNYITEQIKSLYNQMPENEKINAKTVLGEVGAMAVADFMSKTFGEFVTGRVTDSKEFVATLMILENNGSLKGTHIEAMKNSLVSFIGSMDTLDSRDMLKGLRKSDIKNVINCRIEEIKGSYNRLQQAGKLAILALKKQAKTVSM